MYPFDKITSVRISVECLVAIDISNYLSYNVFACSIINRYGSHLKMKKLSMH